MVYKVKAYTTVRLDRAGETKRLIAGEPLPHPKDKSVGVTKEKQRIGSKGSLDFTIVTDENRIKPIIQTVEEDYKGADKAELISHLQQSKRYIDVDYVESYQQHSYVGDAMIKRVQQIAVIENADFLVTSAHRGNWKVVRLLERNGWKKITDYPDLDTWIKIPQK